MTAYTQKYKALVMAPWLSEPQVQFATFTFDDATPAEFPTWATVRRELARRSAFNDSDATDTGDKWATSGKDANLETIEVAKFDMLYLAEFNPYQDLGNVCPPNLAKDSAYVWPAVGNDGLALGGTGALDVFTIAGDDYLAGNIADADDTPPVVAEAPYPAEAVEVGDSLVIVVNGAQVYNQPFALDDPETPTKLETAATDVSGITAADVYTTYAFIRKANGATSRGLTRTITNS